MKEMWKDYGKTHSLADLLWDICKMSAVCITMWLFLVIVICLFG